MPFEIFMYVSYILEIKRTFPLKLAEFSDGCHSN